MKRLMLLVVTALMMLPSAAVFAQATPQEQYLCKLQAGNCMKRADAVQRKMQRLETEIKSDEKVYSAAELKAIEDKLKEVEKMLDELKAR